LRRRHVPLRTCLGCGERDTKKNLSRFVRREDGALEPAAEARGRGGYLHRREECWRAFLKRKGLGRALRAEVAPGAREELVRRLRSEGESKPVT
jgi:predicted RNA-binding protein YlxR (DUF448 family)